MSELAKRLAALCWPSVEAALEVLPSDWGPAHGESIEHEITEAIYFPIATELERMALEEATNDEAEMDRDLTDPAVAKNYVLSLSKEVVSTRHKVDVLRTLCLKHEAELAMHLDRQAAMHEAELNALRASNDGLREQLEGKSKSYDALLGTAHALGLFAENHRKFVSAWGPVKSYLQNAIDHAHAALPRTVMLTLDEDGQWRIEMTYYSNLERDHVTEYTETNYGSQDAPLPRLLASWCTRKETLRGR